MTMFDCPHCGDRHHVNDFCATGPMSADAGDSIAAYWRKSTTASSVGIAAGDAHKPEAPTPLIDQYRSLETVAKIIDPEAFDWRWSATVMTNTGIRRRNKAIAKAEAILQALAVMSPRIDKGNSPLQPQGASVPTETRKGRL